MLLTSKLFTIFLLAFANTQVTPLSNTAESSSAASSVSLTGPIWLTQQQMDDWMALKGDMDAHVPNGFNDCNSEIDDAYVQAVAQYSSGLSDNFFSALNYIIAVAGDVNEYSQFRSQFQNLSSHFYTYYNSTITARAEAKAKEEEEAEAEAEAKAEAKAKSEAEERVRANGATAGQSLNGQSHPPSAVFVQATDAPHAYGVVNGESTFRSTTVALGMAISALFLLP